MTHIEKLLEQSKKLRDAATQLPWKGNEFEIVAPKALTFTDGGVKLVLAEDYHFNEWDAEFVIHSCNTSACKDAILAVAVEALNDILRGCPSRHNASPLCSWPEHAIARDTLAKIDEIARGVCEV